MQNPVMLGEKFYVAVVKPQQRMIGVMLQCQDFFDAGTLQVDGHDVGECASLDALE